MVLDFAIISILLVIGHLLRAGVKGLQFLLIPASLLAGFLGLVGGEGVLGILPFQHTLEGKVAMASYPSELVALVFATLFMGNQPERPPLRGIFREVGDTFFYNLASYVGQFGFALLFGLVILMPLFPQLDPGFALMLPAAFAGGHGTANVVGTVLEEHGWEGALTIGNTLATIGLLTGIVGGLGIINVATRMGWTRFVKTAQELPADIRSGFLSERSQESLGRATISPMSLDPLAWHMGLVLAAYAIAKGIDAGVRLVVPGKYLLPLFAVSMLVGAGMQISLERFGLGKFVDRTIIKRIGSSLSDYLIAFGVASIKLQIVWDYAAPLAILSAFGCVFTVIMLWYFGPRMFHDNWFERSIFCYGWATGIVATGILLLRVVDPRLRSRTLDDYGVAYVAISPIEILLLVAVPPLVANRIILAPAIVLIGMFLACIVLSARMVGWFSPQPSFAPALEGGGEPEEA